MALPHDADPEAATVRLADGLLELTVPRVKRTISIAAPSAPNALSPSEPGRWRGVGTVRRLLDPPGAEQRRNAGSLTRRAAQLDCYRQVYCTYRRCASLHVFIATDRLHRRPN